MKDKYKQIRRKAFAEFSELYAPFSPAMAFAKLPSKLQKIILACQAVGVLIGAGVIGYMEYKIHEPQIQSYVQELWQVPPIMAGPGAIVRQEHLKGIEYLATKLPE